jgi:hypothetical protein
LRRGAGDAKPQPQKTNRKELNRAENFRGADGRLSRKFPLFKEFLGGTRKKNNTLRPGARQQ